MIRYLNRRRALLARLERCQARYLRLVADHDRERTLNNDLLAEVQDLTAQRDQARAIAVDLEQQLAVEIQASRDLVAAVNGRGRELRIRRDDLVDALKADVKRLTADRDRARDTATRMADLADRMQAAAEAADLPIGLDVTAEDYRAAVRTVIEDVARRAAAAPDRPCDHCGTETIDDPDAAKVGLGTLLCSNCLDEVASWPPRPPTCGPWPRSGGRFAGQPPASTQS